MEDAVEEEGEEEQEDVKDLELRSLSSSHPSLKVDNTSPILASLEAADLWGKFIFSVFSSILTFSFPSLPSL